MAGGKPAREIAGGDISEQPPRVTFVLGVRASQMVLVVSTQPANAAERGDVGLIPGSGRSPGGGHGHPLQYSCLENPQGQRSLVGCGPWGRKELDMTEAT